MKKGFTALEILIVVAIALVIIGISFAAFNNLNSSQALITQSNTLLSLIERARLLSVASNSSSEYGIHFASSSAILFMGKTYFSASSTSEIANFNSKVQLKSINLSNGGPDFYFNRISGKPSATGTVVLYLVGNASSTRTITIYNTGLSDLK